MIREVLHKAEYKTWIYIYGVLSRNGNQNSKYSRLFQNITERYLLYTKLNTKFELTYTVFWYWNGNQNIPDYSRILLKGTFSKQSWIQNLNRHLWYFDIEMVIKIFQNILEYYWKVSSLNKAEYKIWIDIYGILRLKLIIINYQRL